MSDFDRQWESLVSETQRSVDGAASKCAFAFGALIKQEFEKFKRLHVPTDDFDWELRQRMQMNLLAKVGSIAGADKLAQQHRRRAPEILQATRSFCNHVSLTDDVAKEGIVFTAELNQRILS